MTTLTDRPHTALLIVDVQNGVMKEAHDRSAVLANLVALVEKARTSGTEVVWVQHTSDELPRGSEVWEYVPELVRREAEPLVHKAYGDSFEDTDLEAVLAERGIGGLVVAGAQTDACIRATLHSAITRGYDATLVSDAHTTEDLTAYGAPAPGEVIAHTNLYWGFHTAPGRTAGTVRTSEVEFGVTAPA
jgi:nicotinamidase-related amidase